MTYIARADALPGLDPVTGFRRLQSHRQVAWLDSSQRRERDGRYSVLAVRPSWTFTAKAGEWSLRWADGRVEGGRGDDLCQLDRLVAWRRVQAPPHAPALPFWGGAIGWIAYDLGRRFEAIPRVATDDLSVPDVHLAWYDSAIVWDHGNEAAWLVSCDDAGRAALLAVVGEKADGADRAESACEDSRRGGVLEAVSDVPRGDYLARVAAVREGIARGEYYQLNLVQRFRCAMPVSSPDLYLRLRARNPAPFSAYLGTDAVDVLCSSPERFLEISPAGDVRTCPIKGTRPRRRDAAGDHGAAAELLASEKERAELLMIVDLLRNDLGRVCEPGTIRVPRLNSIESFATVHHLVGEVTGRLRPSIAPSELLRATFPGGSITGAPKVSAMHAIERLEPHRRGIAMGAIGYFSAHGRIDLNIAIRTIVVKGGFAHVSVGAGIVWDSDPASEYEETLAKGLALFEALGATPRIA